MERTGPTIFEGYLLRTRFLNGEYVDEQNACSPRAHAHPEHLVFWPSHGTASLEVDGVQRRLAPGQGLWVPAGTPHRAQRRETTLVALHIAPEAWTRRSDEVRAVTVLPALRELLTHLARAPMSREERLRAQQVCLDLIVSEASPSIELPLPDDHRLTQICRRVLADPADDRTIEAWAVEVSLSSRTLARAFKESTGMTFTHWRSCARMSLAVELLGGGMPVGVVARRVGYSTIAAFSTAFHRILGRPPRDFHPS
ncbi:MAG: helix-turn-helix domain-containing protein [Mycetocola sp.]